ncbi:glycosyltransferase family 4 protein [Bizionia sediminis]|uniref:Glycosyltransferase family 4 protein n=1 Tax=Bizionia sediminis TaxID=1737064 RepID=A0ABW5KNS0_9FLAO
MKKIALLHPFSAQAIGLHEQDLYFSHSKPHEQALRALQKQGFAVSIDYFTGRLFTYTKNCLGIKKRFWSVTKPIFKKRHGWRKQYSLFHYLSTIICPADVTIINMSGHGSPYCFKLAQLLVKKQKPYIALIGGMHVANSLKASYYYKNAHHVLVHTAVQKQQLAQQAIFKNLDIRVMPLGVDTTIFVPIEKTLETIELLYVGRISRLKQIELCLKTLAYLIKQQQKPVHLKIIGPISDGCYYDELQVLAKDLNLEPHLTFEGTVKQTDLVPYYQKASLLLLPSAHESFGMVMVEAMACGTPIIAMAGAGGPDELVQNGVNGLLCSKSEFSVLTAALVKDEFAWRTLGKNARQSVLNQWSLEVTCITMEESVNSALK